MTALTADQFDALTAALAKRDVGARGFADGYTLVATVAIAHLTPGVDVAGDLMRTTGVVGSSARRMAAAALEALGPRPSDPEHVLRQALADAVHHLENPNQVPPANRVRQLRALAGVRLADVPRGTGFDRGMEGSTRAAAKWTDDEVKAVDDAIVEAATRGHTVTGGVYAPEFTADDVWDVLGDGFLVTKGLAGRFNAAAHRGVIIHAGHTVVSTRDGEHGHAQRLTVWMASPLTRANGETP